MVSSTWIFLLIVASSSIFSTAHNCIHQKLPKHLDFIDTSEPLTGRLLAGESPIRITPDFTYFTNVTTEFSNYVKSRLVVDAINFFQSTLSVTPLRSPLKIPLSKVCDFPTPTQYQNPGVVTDLLIFVRAVYDEESYIAAARACILSSGTFRPVVGEMFFNTRLVKPKDEILFQNHILTTLHEMTHVLGFSSDLYPYYIDPATLQPLKNIVVQKRINGINQNYLNLPQLTPRVQSYFGCSNLAGGLLEDEGGVGSQGSHWERKTFFNEYMTASDISDARVSQFTLALLEGTGWYRVNYSIAEPMVWGKNKGCGFYTDQCINTQTMSPNFEEFCLPLMSQGCSFTRRGKAFCGSTRIITDPSLNPNMDYFHNKTIVYDQFVDNCPYMMQYSNTDCEDPYSVAVSYLKEEVFDTGSRCFTGAIYSRTPPPKKLSYCFKYSCVNQELMIQIGDNQVSCNKEGPVSVPGFSGALDCPNPSFFCENIGVSYCRRGCLGNGICNPNGECTCFDGWAGTDCGFPTGITSGGDIPATGGSDKTNKSSSSNTSLAIIVGILLVLGLFYYMRNKSQIERQAHPEDQYIEMRNV